MKILMSLECSHVGNGPGTFTDQLFLLVEICTWLGASKWTSCCGWRLQQHTDSLCMVLGLL